MLVCPHNLKTGQAEVALIKATKGDKAVYVAQKAWRAEKVQKGSVPVSVNEISKWSAFLSKAQVCNDAIKDRTCAPVFEAWKKLEYLEFKEK